MGEKDREKARDEHDGGGDGVDGEELSDRGGGGGGSRSEGGGGGGDGSCSRRDRSNRSCVGHVSGRGGGGGEETGSDGEASARGGGGGGGGGGSRSGGAEVCGREAETVARAGISFSMSAAGPGGRGGRRYRSPTASLSARVSYVVK